MASKRSGSLRDYVAIARLDHSTKHVFIIPGMMLAYLLRGNHASSLAQQVVLGLITAISIASANYAINEWLDREFDQYHPKKSQRTSVQRRMKGEMVFAEWLLLVAVGLGCAYASSLPMLLIAIVFALQGIVYNVKPFRTKDKAYLDVISESINNPLRLMIGWAMLDPATIPPASIILAYWCGGAFLMAAKRYSEYREIVATCGRDLLVRYRASFGGYAESSLNVSCFTYGLLSNFFLAIFLMKYRIEYLLLIPLVTALFAQYLALAMQSGSAAQSPEKLFRERGLIATVLLLAAAFTATTFIDVPQLSAFAEQRYIFLTR